MIVLFFTLLLYAIAAAMWGVAWRRQDGSAMAATREAFYDFLNLIPRLAVGILGAGFLARVLPQDFVTAWLGPKSGFVGLSFASIAGALTPGGPVVGFAMGSAALKAGAGLPQIVAYVTAWSLFTLNRVLIWEVPVLPASFVWLRIIVSLPLPFLAAGLVALLG